MDLDVVFFYVRAPQIATETLLLRNMLNKYFIQQQQQQQHTRQMEEKKLPRWWITMTTGKTVKNSKMTLTYIPHLQTNHVWPPFFSSFRWIHVLWHKKIWMAVVLVGNFFFFHGFDRNSLNSMMFAYLRWKCFSFEVEGDSCEAIS